MRLRSGRQRKEGPVAWSLCWLHVSERLEEIVCVCLTESFSHLSLSLCGYWRVLQDLLAHSADVWVLMHVINTCSCLHLFHPVFEQILWWWWFIIRFQQTPNTHYNSSCNFLWLHAWWMCEKKNPSDLHGSREIWRDQNIIQTKGWTLLTWTSTQSLRTP